MSFAGPRPGRTPPGRSNPRQFSEYYITDLPKRKPLHTVPLVSNLKFLMGTMEPRITRNALNCFPFRMIRDVRGSFYSLACSFLFGQDLQDLQDSQAIGQSVVAGLLRVRRSLGRRRNRATDATAGLPAVLTAGLLETFGRRGGSVRRPATTKTFGRRGGSAFRIPHSALRIQHSAYAARLRVMPIRPRQSPVAILFIDHVPPPPSEYAWSCPQSIKSDNSWLSLFFPLFLYSF